MFSLKTRVAYLSYLLLTVCLLGIATIATAQTSQPYTCADITEISQEECQVLQDLYDAEVYATLFASTTPCDSSSISCESNMITRLNLFRNGTAITYPDSLGNLTNLTSLKINTQYVLETLPDSLGNLSNLTFLEIEENDSLIELSDSLGDLSNLSSLRIIRNDSLTALPESLGNLTNLTSLMISRNKELTALPDSLGNLTNLTSLTIYGNEGLMELPDSLGNLINITSSLSISENDSLTVLPESLGDLTNLTSLTISGNDSLTVLPESLGDLTNLTSLTISGNDRLTALPESLGDLPNLTSLTILGNNHLTALPDSLGNLPNLTSLTISENVHLMELPDSLGNLSNLTVLDIDANDSLLLLPDSLGNLTNLTSLEITDNDSLTILPVESLSNLTNLSVLRIDYNNTVITSIDSLSDLTHRTSLYIRRNSSITTLPESLGTLTHLTYLTIANNNKLTTLPDSLGNLTNLTSLTISENYNLTELPDSLGDLTNLVSLSLLANRSFNHLPDSLGSLTNLERLIINGSKLTTLPDSLGNLTNLTRLVIRDNLELTTLPDSLGNLTDLQNLAVYENGALATLPDSLIDLVNLQELRIESNSDLITLPENFRLSEFPALIKFDVDGYIPSSCLDSHTAIECQALQDLFDANLGNDSWFTTINPCEWDYIGCGLPGKITRLTIDQTDLIELPDVIKSLESLRELVVTNSIELQDVSIIGELKNLRVLELSNLDSIVALPETIATLQSLEGITIQDNDSLHYIPSSITEENFSRIVESQDDWEGYPTENAIVYGYYDVQVATVEPVFDVAGEPFVFFDNAGIAHIRLTPETEDERLTFTFDSFTCTNRPTDVLFLSGDTTLPMNRVDGNNVYMISVVVPSELGAVASSYDIDVQYRCNSYEDPITVSAAQISLYAPNGIVTDRFGIPIEGAYVTLHHKVGLLPDTDQETNDCRTADTRIEDSWTSLPSAELSGVDLYDEGASAYPQTNVQITGADGTYAWDVTDGCWYVRVSAEGYESVVSPLAGTSPTILDLDLQMQAIVLEEKIPTAINTLIYDDSTQSTSIVWIVMIGWFLVLFGAFIYLLNKYGLRMFRMEE